MDYITGYDAVLSQTHNWCDAYITASGTTGNPGGRAVVILMQGKGVRHFLSQVPDEARLRRLDNIV